LKLLQATKLSGSVHLIAGTVRAAADGDFFGMLVVVGFVCDTAPMSLKPRPKSTIIENVKLRRLFMM